MKPISLMSAGAFMGKISEAFSGNQPIAGAVFIAVHSDGSISSAASSPKNTANKLAIMGAMDMVKGRIHAQVDERRHDGVVLPTFEQLQHMVGRILRNGATVSSRGESVGQLSGAQQSGPTTGGEASGDTAASSTPAPAVEAGAKRTVPAARGGILRAAATKKKTKKKAKRSSKR